MSRSIQLHKDQKYIYKVEILQIFKPQSYEERSSGAERVRLDKPEVMEIGWYDTPGAARNYGSYVSGRSAWYKNVGKPKTEWRRFEKATGKMMHANFYPDYGKWNEYEGRQVDVPQPREPDKDYRVYRIPVNLDMGEAVLLPPLKRLYEVEE